MSELSDVDLDRLKRHAEYGHLEGQDYDLIEALVDEVRQLREASANAAALVEEVWTLKGEMADLGKRATNAIELAKADRDRLADAIRTHCGVHQKWADRREGWEEATLEADITLWAALDQEGAA